MNKLTRDDLIPFLAAAQAKVTVDYLAWAGNSDYAYCHPHILSLDVGVRYARIVVANNASRSCFGFVDLTNGDVLKSASWKTPAKNFARGNINDADKGCGRIKWTGVY